MILARTRAICNRCLSPHPAEWVRTDNRIEGVVHCPAGELRHEITSDADLFLAIRNKCPTDYAEPVPVPGLRFALNFIPITNACNLDCTVCGAAAKTGTAGAVFLPMEEVVRRARNIRKCGGRFLYLFGGEPTLHPDLLEMVHTLSRMGFHPGLATNGLRLGTDPALAGELQRRGLRRVGLQFDSLQEGVLDKLGRNFLPEKTAAIRHVLAAGLSLGLNCTVTRFNLEEVGHLLVHGLELGAGVKSLMFFSAAPIGRYKLALQDSTDREQILHRLLPALQAYGANLDDVLPLPAYRPWGIQPHPDCGAHIVMVRTPRGIQPLNRLVDLPSLYRRLGRSRLKNGFFATYFAPAAFVLQSVRRGQGIACLRLAAGLLFNRRRHALVNVGVSHYKGAAFLDEQRLARCSSAFHLADGPVKGCIHFFAHASDSGSGDSIMGARSLSQCTSP
jgi:MoaA/NifB/PqqE/SkfB family radical SAM enzyme